MLMPEGWKTLRSDGSNHTDACELMKEMYQALEAAQATIHQICDPEGKKVHSEVCEMVDNTLIKFREWDEYLGA